MKAVILAGGKGARISEESALRPKPLIEIGGRPILWHILRSYSSHGINDFIICAGYRGYMIKEYFVNLHLHHADVTVDLATGRLTHHGSDAPPWTVTVVDTGLETMTGGRLRRIRPFLNAGEPFCMTYGDGVSDVDIAASIAFHKARGRKATVTIVRPPARFGAIDLDGDRVAAFREKIDADGGFINGGFFVLEPSALDLIAGDDTVWEREPLERLAAEGELSAFRHDGFWQPMDTLREKTILESLWDGGAAPWAPRG